MVAKVSLMIVYDDDAGATQRCFMVMEREDLKHRSDVERLMISLLLTFTPSLIMRSSVCAWGSGL